MQNLYVFKNMFYDKYFKNYNLKKVSTLKKNIDSRQIKHYKRDQHWGRCKVYAYMHDQH